jgi:hypothetical protein
MNGPNKLECYITVDWEGLAGTKILPVWAYSLVMKKIKCCEYNYSTHYNNNSSLSL